MKRAVVDYFGGPEVLRVVEEDDPRPGVGQVCVRVLSGGGLVHRSADPGRHLPRGAEAPFTPSYELVGVVEDLGPGCATLRRGDRVAAAAETQAIKVGNDLDPAEVVSLEFPDRAFGSLSPVRSC